MKFDIKRYITGQILVIIIFSMGFISGSYLGVSAIQAYVEFNYECFPISLKAQNEK